MRPNSKNIESIKKFFRDNEYLTSYELAKLAGVHRSQISSWRKKCKAESVYVTDMSFARPHQTAKKELPEIRDPDIWDNHDWFHEYYRERKFGQLAISRIIGKHVDVVRTRLRRYKIRMRSHREAMEEEFGHPCNNKEWLEEHYVRLRKPVRALARMAKVNYYTICNWLTAHDIEIRDAHEAGVVKKMTYAAKPINTNGSKRGRWELPEKKRNTAYKFVSDGPSNTEEIAEGA